MVSKIPTVKHEADEKGNKILFVSVSVFGKEVHEELFFLISLDEFGEHLINSGLPFFQEIFITLGLKLLIKSHSPSGILDDFVAFGVGSGRFNVNKAT
jgi:hypothetical protein